MLSKNYTLCLGEKIINDSLLFEFKENKKDSKRKKKKIFL